MQTRLGRARWLIRTCMVLALGLVLALALPARGDEEFLAPELAFKATLRMVDASTAELRYDVVDGCYMYRGRFRFSGPEGRIG